MSYPSDQSEYWNNAARTKVFSHPLDIQRFLQRVPLDARILDVGCGQGRLCYALSEAGYDNVLGVDYAAGMIELARSRYPKIDFRVVDGHALPFAEADAIILFAVLTCIPDSDQQEALIREIHRVLRPGGILLISDYPLQSDERNQTRYQAFAGEFIDYGTFRLADGAVVRHHRIEWLSELLSAFSISEIVELDAKTMNGNRAQIVQIWAQKSPPLQCEG